MIHLHCVMYENHVFAPCLFHLLLALWLKHENGPHLVVCLPAWLLLGHTCPLFMEAMGSEFKIHWVWGKFLVCLEERHRGGNRVEKWKSEEYFLDVHLATLVSVFLVRTLMHWFLCLMMGICTCSSFLIWWSVLWWYYEEPNWNSGGSCQMGDLYREFWTSQQQGLQIM